MKSACFVLLFVTMMSKLVGSVPLLAPAAAGAGFTTMQGYWLYDIGKTARTVEGMVHEMNPVVNFLRTLGQNLFDGRFLGGFNVISKNLKDFQDPKIANSALKALNLIRFEFSHQMDNALKMGSRQSHDVKLRNEELFKLPK